MKFLKYLFLVITFLGFLSTNLDAKVILIEDEKEISFSEEGFKEQTKESKWLGLLYLKEEFNSQSQSSFSKYPLRSLFQNFSGEVCSKNRAFKHKTRKVELVDEDALDGFVTKLSDDAVGDAAKKKDLVDALSLDNVSAEEFSIFGKLANDNPKLLTKEYFEEVRGILKHKDGEKLVDSWAVLKKTEIDGLSGKVENLEGLNKALKQEGYDADYFETLLKSKDDPQKFLDDYVSKIGENGKFADDALETDYTSYLSRKAREGKPPRDRADWNHTRDYMLNDSPLARGNNFNRKAWENEWYPAWEVQLDNGKFIDGYNPFTKEIVSRKATDLVDISESTFRGYLDELVTKYAPPKKITTKKQGAIYDQLRANPDLPLDSKLILEIPESNRTFFDIDRYTQIASEKGITIKFAPE